MNAVPSPIDFRANTRRVPPNIPAAIQRATARLVANRIAASAQIPAWENLRQTAHDLRLHTIEHLDEYIAQVEQSVAARGGRVHHARDAVHACAIVTELARERGVKTVVKSKSMATEEIGLNRALEHTGVRSFETDVGEFIIQLAGAHPAHILAPAIDMTKEEIAALFAEKLGVDAPPEPRALTEIVRAHLREQFLRAEMGISGANFVIAETGTVVLLTNEGNGRLCTTLPEIYVAIAGIDKIIPDWDGAAILLQLLARSATGQKMACHTSFITGARGAAREFGPREFHLILLDNGRSHIRQDTAARETLLCIRCAACLNICPIYNHVGGHAYGGVYSGPIGAILSPQLLGMNIARDLPYASTLCGACADVCPVKIPIPQILLHLRQRVAEGDAIERATVPPAARVAARLGGVVMASSRVYQASARLAQIAQTVFRRGEWLPALPPPLNRWTRVRPMPAVAGRFRKWWRARALPVTLSGAKSLVASTTDKISFRAHELQQEQPSNHQSLPNETTPLDQLLAEINRVSGTARRVNADQFDGALKHLIELENIRTAALWRTEVFARLNLIERLRECGVDVLPPDADKHALALADLGITEVDFAIPDSGTLGLLSSADKPRAVSILPRIHLAILRERALCADLRQMFKEARKEIYLVLVTGLSRTSDIETNPVLGAHGPKSLCVWAIE